MLGVTWGPDQPLPLSPPRCTRLGAEMSQEEVLRLGLATCVTMVKVTDQRQICNERFSKLSKFDGPTCTDAGQEIENHEKHAHVKQTP